MEVIVTSLCGVSLLRITGEVDHSTSPTLDEAAQKAHRLDSSRLLLDLTDCAYFDSGGLAVILSILRNMRPKGWLGVIGANANLLRLFEITGLTVDPCFHLFPSWEDTSAALASWAG